MKKKTVITLWMSLLCGILLFTGCESKKTTAAEEERISYFPYRTMKELSALPNDSENLKKMAESLPVIEPYLQFKGIELSEDQKELILKYDELYLKEWVEKLPEYHQPDNPMFFSPYFRTRTLNNALLLFLMRDGVETVRYEFHIPNEYLHNQEDGKDIRTETYSRSELDKILGNLNEAGENADYYHILLDYNNAVAGERIHFNRVRLGSTEKWLLYRNGEPDAKITYPGEENNIAYLYGEFGHNVKFIFSPYETGEERTIMMISADSTPEDLGGGEMLPNIGLVPPDGEPLKKERVLEYLGPPRISFEGVESYRINTGLSDYLFFQYNEKEEVIRFGIVRKAVQTIPFSE